MLLAIWDDGVWQDAAIFAGVAFGAYLLVTWIAALVWAYRDVQTRTGDPFTQVLSLVLVLVFGLPGLLIYLILRPKHTLAERYDRQLEAEALLHELEEQVSCPACRRRVQDDFLSCPYCATALRSPCDRCGKPIAAGWVLCPYCGTDRATAVPEPRTSVAVEADAAPSGRPRRPASTARYTPAAGATTAPASTAASDATADGA